MLFRSLNHTTLEKACFDIDGVLCVDPADEQNDDGENYTDFTTVNGHAKLKDKSKNTNFAILVTIQLTEPFNDPTGYGSYIAKMSNLLAGEGKVILQTYQHFKDSKRSKNLYRVLPTLPEDKYILGDINLAFPRRIIESIVDFVEQLNSVIPGISNPDNLVYAPEIKFYSNTN